MHTIQSPQSRRLGLRLLASARALLTVSALSALAVSHVSVAQTLTPVSIALTPGGWGEVKAVANGYVVGGANTAGSERHAFRWSAATQTIQDINPTGSTFSVATGVNASGEVAGIYSDAAGWMKTFYWSAGAGFVLIDATIANFSVSPVLIGDNGVVGGTDNNAHVFRWTQADGLQDLGTPLNGVSQYDLGLSGINARGDMIGNAGSGGSGHAVGFVAFASSNTLTILMSPGDATPRGIHHGHDVNIQLRGINDSGVVVGTYWDFKYIWDWGLEWTHNSHAFNWTSGGGFTDLGKFGTYSVSLNPNLHFFASASAINNAGVIVGNSSLSGGGGAPFIYDPATGQMTQLTSAGTDFGPVAINDDGIIAGSASSQMHAAVLINGVRTNIVPVFAPLYNGTPGLPLMKGSTFASHGYPNDFSVQRAWAMGLPSAPPPPPAPLFFTDALTGSSPNLTIPAAKYGPVPAGLRRNQSDNRTDRPMVFTNSGAYLTAANFTADLTVTLATDDLLYFGLGQGDADSAYFNEPSHAFYFRVHSRFDGHSYDIHAAVRSSPTSWHAISTIGTYSLGSTITLRITRAGDTITLSIVGGGSTSHSLSAYQAALELTNSNTRVFFGNTTVGSIFTNLNIYESLPDTTPPVITAPADITAEATGPSGAAVNFTATATDDTDGAVPVTAVPPSGSTFPIATTIVGLAASDTAYNTASASFRVTVQDTTAPVVSVPGNITAEATSASGAAVSYPAPTATDAVGVTSLSSIPASGSTFALGSTTVTATARDAAGNTGTGSFTITVRDTTAPTLASVTPSSATLWPPNHQMVAITLTTRVSDLVGVTGYLVTATSSEPDNGLGDGDTANDIQITGSGTLNPVINLRAERSGKGNGRVYTISVKAVDAAGNVTPVATTVTVTVPKSQGGK